MSLHLLLQSRLPDETLESAQENMQGDGVWLEGRPSREPTVDRCGRGWRPKAGGKQPLGVSELPSDMALLSAPWGGSLASQHVTDHGAAAAAAAKAKPDPASVAPGAGPEQKLQRTIVKVQVPMVEYDYAKTKEKEPEGPLLVYDRTRAWQRSIDKNHPQFKDIIRSVRASKTGMGLKAYLYATIAKDGNVSFSLAEHAPPQDW
jgi:hypothetical protein